MTLEKIIKSKEELQKYKNHRLPNDEFWKLINIIRFIIREEEMFLKPFDKIIEKIIYKLQWNESTDKNISNEEHFKIGFRRFDEHLDFIISALSF